MSHPSPERDARRESLIASAVHIVDAEARRYRVWRMQRADLHQAGILGLLVAADRFDDTRGVPFKAFAAHWVRKEIQRAIADQEFASSIPATSIGSAVALRGILAQPHADLRVAAAALGISPASVEALHRQLPNTTTASVGQHDDPAGVEIADMLPGSAFPNPEAAANATSTGAALRARAHHPRPRRTRRPGTALRTRRRPRPITARGRGHPRTLRPHHPGPHRPQPPTPTCRTDLTDPAVCPEPSRPRGPPATRQWADPRGAVYDRWSDGAARRA